MCPFIVFANLSFVCEGFYKIKWLHWPGSPGHIRAVKSEEAHWQCNNVAGSWFFCWSIFWGGEAGFLSESAYLFFSAVAAPPRKRTRRKSIFKAKRDWGDGLMPSGAGFPVQWLMLDLSGHPPFGSSSMGVTASDTALSHCIQQLPEMVLGYRPCLEILCFVIRLAVEYISSILRHLTLLSFNK